MISESINNNDDEVLLLIFHISDLFGFVSNQSINFFCICACIVYIIIWRRAGLASEVRVSNICFWGVDLSRVARDSTGGKAKRGGGVALFVFHRHRTQYAPYPLVQILKKHAFRLCSDPITSSQPHTHCLRGTPHCRSLP